ncbi:hypothetical protein [Trichoplusia ni ascovirus 6b]|nr:hypothetical protein [Trichoplusia ni ascovirus 6b]
MYISRNTTVISLTFTTKMYPLWCFVLLVIMIAIITTTVDAVCKHDFCLNSCRRDSLLRLAVTARCNTNTGLCECFNFGIPFERNS